MDDTCDQGGGTAPGLCQQDWEDAPVSVGSHQDTTWSGSKKVKEVTSLLEETRDKLQVIDVDDDDDTKRGGGKWKRNMQMSPDNGNGKKVCANANVAATSQLINMAPASDISFNGYGNIVETIVVEGAGTVEVNGTYKLCHSYDDCSSYPNKNFPV